MSKVILVMDDPMYCLNCPLARKRPSDNGYICGIGHPGIKEDQFGWTYEAVDLDAKTKPDWCPLKGLPNHFICFGDEDDFSAGYNECLDDILGE